MQFAIQHSYMHHAIWDMNMVRHGCLACHAGMSSQYIIFMQAPDTIKKLFVLGVLDDKF